MRLVVGIVCISVVSGCVWFARNEMKARGEFNLMFLSFGFWMIASDPFACWKNDLKNHRKGKNFLFQKTDKLVLNTYSEI